MKKTSDEQDRGTWIRNPHFTFIRCNADEIMVKHGRRSLFSEIIRDDARNGILADVTEFLFFERSFKELKDTFESVDREELSKLLLWLKERGVVVQGDDANDRIGMYVLVTGSQHKLSHLSNAKLGIVGGGAVGVRIATSFADFGIGTIQQLSDVTIESSEDSRISRVNIPRDAAPINSAKALEQYVFPEYFRGKYSAIDGDENDAENMRAVFSSVDVVVVAMDSYSPDALHTANEVAIELNRTWLFVYIDGSEISMGPIFVPGETPCYLELAIQEDAGLKWRGQSWLYNEKKMNLAQKSPGTNLHRPLSTMIPCHADVASGIVIREMLRFLVYGISSLQSRNLQISFEDLEFVHSNVMSLPRCPACSVTRAPYRSTFY